jgi:hypothetical protein
MPIMDSPCCEHCIMIQNVLPPCCFCDLTIYITHACLLDAPRKFSNDFPQARTVYSILSSPPTTNLYTRCKKYQHRNILTP